MDVTEDTFSQDYFKRIIKEGILLICEVNSDVVGVCFGKYNLKEKWSDLLGIVVKQSHRNSGIGRLLMSRFEEECLRKGLTSIDLYAYENQCYFFEKLDFTKGKTYVAFRKELS